MNVVRFFPFLFLPLFSSDAEAGSTSVDAIKGMLPACTNNLSLYEKLKEIDEVPFGGGVENSQFAAQQGGLGLSFFLKKENGSWSFLVTDKNQKTCFVSTGKNWQRPKMDVPWKIILGGKEKQVGYCAPLEKIKKTLLEEGKMEYGFGDQDISLSETNVFGVTVHFFKDAEGSFAAVTNVIYKSSVEFACIDAKGVGWKFEDSY